MINTVCENALIAAFAGKSQVVRTEVIDEVAKDLRLNVLTHRPIAANSVTERQRAVAQSLLGLVEALEQIARPTDVREAPTDQGVKIV